MNSEEIKKITELIENKEPDKVKELLNDLHPADIAELCNELNAENARFVYLLLDNETAADVLVEMDEDARKEFLDILPSETIAKRFVDYMDSDDAVDIIREMDEDKQEEVLSHIEDIEQAGDIVDLLKYDEDSLMGTEMVIVKENWSMPECLREMRIQAEDMDEIYYVYVVDDDERLRGVFPLKKMITSPSVSKVKHVMKKDPVSVHVDTHRQLHDFRKFRQYICRTSRNGIIYSVNWWYGRKRRYTVISTCGTRTGKQFIRLRQHI